MSENQPAQEKTEQATPKRLEDARKKGQVPRSRELSTMAVMISGAAVFILLGGWMAGELRGLLAEGLTLRNADIGAPERVWPALRERVVDALMTLAPLFAVVTAAALVAPAALGGFTFSADAAAPKLSRLSVLKGLGRTFSARGAMELGKTLLKFSLLVALGAFVLWSFRHELLALGGQPLEQAASNAARLIGSALMILAGALFVIAAVDVPFQLWNHARQLKMTRQEVKDELKQTDGNPEVRAKRRRLQQEAAQARMMEAVPLADVVVTNPTHYAVALRYSADRDRAPRVVAKGADQVAARIRALAEQHAVPLCAAPPLARALHDSTAIGDEVPAPLYTAVARVLAWV